MLMKLSSKTVLMGYCVSLAMLFGAMFSSSAQAQSLSVSGRVVDETNQPVIGAGVQEKGSTNGAVTDLDGYYTITTKANAVLVFSSLGYDTKEVAVNGNTSINDVLSGSSTPPVRSEPSSLRHRASASSRMPVSPVTDSMSTSAVWVPSAHTSPSM